MTLGKFAKKVVLAGLTTMAMASAAQATNVLLFDDFVHSNDVWGSALSGLGLSVTTVSSDGAFNAAITGSYDLVVVQFDSTGHSINLNSYLSGGGKLIYSNWMATDDATVGVTQGAYNQYNLTITSAALAAGLSSATQTLTNPTYGIFSREVSGAVSLATLGSASGILNTVGGKVIVNGFLGETLVSTSDEVRLYQNEVNMLAAVPEPATYAMLGVGLAMLGFAARKKRAS
ncbi:PEP-CTERM sorting domain-containing protein [Duganella sp. FT135W]|uniref:PEP-CTERM sorting domain-containing protein n=1 Tax=Duganella flavida TaxID=2692175 RepID=A0A6L8K516_9BURK|nr:PEP-CTERM sorting domain-containing protein [Duganella flavida]MYM22593.1 PEP-CTERM sorting domain-containing protein [Duganella flavida]